MPLDLPTGQAFVAESKSVRQFINKEGDTMETTKIRLAFDNMAKQFCSDYLYDGRKDYRGYTIPFQSHEAELYLQKLKDCRFVKDLKIINEHTFSFSIIPDELKKYVVWAEQNPVF